MDVPVVDLSVFLTNPDSEEAKAECLKLKETLQELGTAVIRDPRVPQEENEVFIDTMERYFGQSNEAKKADERPEIGYQVGVTPELKEVPLCAASKECIDSIEKQSPENKAHVPVGPDPKWRFFWRLGERPTETKYAQLNAEPVIPQAFPEWESVMNRWGGLLLEAVGTATEMLSEGYGMPRKFLRDMTNMAPHVLAPTGSDLVKYNKKDTIFAGYHYDLNFITIHGKSRFPGLFVWKRDGKKVAVKVPDGCLLIQAGKQLEWVTGGDIAAGFHEVVVTDRTIEAIEKAKQEGNSLWRVSSTVFQHIASDQKLRPLTEFGFKANDELYPELCAGEQVSRELSALQLKKPATSA
eukprot:Nk52_evm93s217 gene=Nk52_evmTU93s217